MATQTPDEQDVRARLCRDLGFGALIDVHKLIVAAVRGGVGGLLNKGLDGPTLTKLGYTSSGMQSLGFDRQALGDLKYPGFTDKPPSKSKSRSRSNPPASRGSDAPRTHKSDSTIDRLRKLIASGARAEKIRSEGFHVKDCRKSGFTPRELSRAGFTINDMKLDFTLNELISGGYGARDLRSYFSGTEFQRAGCTGAEMRGAGFSVRDLLNFGYNENLVKTAGYSIVELFREGLSSRTIDKTRLQS